MSPQIRTSRRKRSSRSQQDRWDEVLRRLQRYRARYGDCRVPAGWSGDPALGRWVHKQRTLRREGKLSKDRQRQLTRLGFSWEPREVTWHQRYQALKRFHARHGHCRVPRWPEAPQFGRWVNAQREARRQGVLSKERIQALDALGFEWSLR